MTARQQLWRAARQRIAFLVLGLVVGWWIAEQFKEFRKKDAAASVSSSVPDPSSYTENNTFLEAKKRKDFLIQRCRSNDGVAVLGFGYSVVCVKKDSAREESVDWPE